MTIAEDFAKRLQADFDRDIDHARLNYDYYLVVCNDFGAAVNAAAVETHHNKDYRLCSVLFKDGSVLEYEPYKDLTRIFSSTIEHAEFHRRLTAWGEESNTAADAPTIAEKFKQDLKAGLDDTNGRKPNYMVNFYRWGQAVHEASVEHKHDRDWTLFAVRFKDGSVIEYLTYTTDPRVFANTAEQTEYHHSLTAWGEPNPEAAAV